MHIFPTFTTHLCNRITRVKSSRLDIIIALPCHVISVNNNPLCGYFLMVIDGTKMKVKMKILLYQGLKAAPHFGIVLVRIIPLGNGFQIEMPKSYGMI